MQHGLFDRMEHDTDAARSARALEAYQRAITRDLEALLNTRCALTAEAFASFPACGASVLHYGLADFAGMCVASDADRQRICIAIRAAIERHEPRVRRVAVSIQGGTVSINRVRFAISAELAGLPQHGTVQFNAVFQPSLQRYALLPGERPQHG